MSKETVEIVRRAIGAWNDDDMDELGALFHEQAIVVEGGNLEGWPETGPYVGREAVMSQFARLRDSRDNDRLEPIGDVADVGDRVAVRLAWQGSGRGPDTNIEMTVVYTVRGDKILLSEFFWDHERALQTIGLRD